MDFNSIIRIDFNKLVRFSKTDKRTVERAIFQLSFFYRQISLIISLKRKLEPTHKTLLKGVAIIGVTILLLRRMIGAA